jgi:uncharacterized protein (DUF433 family)
MVGQHTAYEGIYEAPEAARIIRATSIALERPIAVNNRHILRWIRNGLALPGLREVPGKELALSFTDLVSMRVIALLRSAGYTWKQIYDSEGWVRSATGAERPFATKSFWLALRQIFTDHEGEILAASLGGQYPFVQLIEDHLVPVAGLTFDEGGVADSWTVLPSDQIVMRPNVQFGAPCIRGTRITTQTVWDMNQGGDSAAFIARVYDVTIEQVQEAIEWEKRLLATAA